MGHPHWSDVLRIADCFELISHAAGEDAKVDMGLGLILDCEEHICGTPACHAGWFGVFWGKMGKNDEYYADFSDYARILAEILGFSRKSHLEQWAHENPEVWGNNYGSDMFYASSAFGLGFKNVTLKDISNHWYGVAKRLHEIQDK